MTKIITSKKFENEYLFKFFLLFHDIEKDYKNKLIKFEGKNLQHIHDLKIIAN